MMDHFSPATERVVQFAQELAQKRHAKQPDLIEWLSALLDDEDGKPRELIPQAYPALMRWQKLPAESYPAPAPEALFAAAQQWALRCRRDRLITTEFLLLAVLQASPTFQVECATVRIDLEELAAKLQLPLPGDHATEAQPSPGLIFDPLLTTATGPVWRVVDANLNRAREAIRVLEDGARFLRNDQFLATSLKELRHGLAAAAQRLSVAELLSGRDTTNDVGTTIQTEREYVRQNPEAVALANWKRLQEALRSCEEYGKIIDPEFAAAIEQLRYRAYSLEVASQTGAAQPDWLHRARLYLLMGPQDGPQSLERIIYESVEGGVDVIQWRDKTLADRERYLQAERVRRWTDQLRVPLIINDRVDIAWFVGAEGVHLGQDDLPLAVVRQQVGQKLRIGVSSHVLAEAEAAILGGADYLGAGPTFPSQTKSFKSFPGLDYLRELAGWQTVPIFALGGIDAQNLPEVLATGQRRIAVSRAITAADDPKAAAMQLASLLRQADAPQPTLELDP